MSADFLFEGTRVRVGVGAMLEAARLPDISDPGDVLIVTGEGSMRDQGHLGRLLSELPEGALLYEGVRADPTITDVQELADFVDGHHPKVLVGLGGGSVMDATKAANVAAGSGARVADLLANPGALQLRSRVERLVLVPSTAGTGSEVTPFATVWDREGGRKYSLDAPCVRAQLALVDPALSAMLPDSLTRRTAGDALTHACEAIWAARATPVSHAHACEAIRWLRAGLAGWVDDTRDPGGRAALAWGSLLAGMAISTTRTAAAHALSYRLTLEHGMPHGAAVCALLPRVLEENWPRLDPVRRARLRAGFGLGPGGDAVAALRGLLEGLGLTWRLSDFGVLDEDLPALVEASQVPGRLDNNVVSLDDEALLRILRGAL